MIIRNLENEIRRVIEDGRSLFLFGPRQTGKTTLLNMIVGRSGDILSFSFLNARLRQQAERDPGFLAQEISAAKPRLVILDEVQKVPGILDEVQLMIDRERTIFLITGSSARKLKRDRANLLAGRAVTFRLDPFDVGERATFESHPELPETLQRILTFGDLPEIGLLTRDGKARLAENLLRSYVETFLEEEIRAETLIRKIGVFGNFLRLAAEASGRILSLSELSRDIGVTHHTVASFFDVLHDAMVIEKIDPLLPAATRRRLVKSSKYLFFDIGVRNAAARQLSAVGIGPMEWGNRFEQWVGLSLLRHMRSRNMAGSLHFWRDHNGPEVDWVVELNGRWIPVEVKWGDTPRPRHCSHLRTFLEEYGDKASRGYLIFTGARPRALDKKILAIPWFRLSEIFPS